ncbi:MAG: zinc-binding dehydrogenase [Gemmatimonadetes bacterium]|nr:zinc-binding dehydrogenase [Gemmatimonadota bacterium]
MRVRACALNGFDPMMLGGTTGLRVPLPMTPCGDAAGKIEAFGPGTDTGGWAVGERVMLDPFIPGRGMLGEKARGAASEYVSVPLENLVRIPDGVSFEHAAALPVAYGTALRMIEDRARVQPGETVLVLGATGGVGCCSVQLCKRIGATVIATGSSDRKLERLREIGADHVLPSRSAELVRMVRAIAGRPRYHAPDSGGVDVVVNYIGGATWAASLRVLRFQGRMVTCGATAGYDPPTDIRYIWSFEQTIIGSDGWTREGLARLLDMVADGELDPAIHAVRPIEKIRESMAELIERDVFGKSVLTL